MESGTSTSHWDGFLSAKCSSGYMLRILFLGENWYGSCARACCYALRRLGCDVTDIDVQTFFLNCKIKFALRCASLMGPGS